MSSKAASERNQRILLELVRLPGNDKCADCHTPNPRWASWNLGIFLCVHCAGVHRKMGTHISKVRSVTLDTWTREQVDAMKHGGNEKSNARYNPDEVRNRPPTNIEQSERGSELERYIRKKYEFKKFMDRGPPPVPQKDPPNMQRKTSSLASPRIPDGRSPTMPSPSPSSSSIQSFPNSTPASNGSSGRPPPSPSPSQVRSGSAANLSASAASTLSVPQRTSSTASAPASSSSASSNANLLIPDIDSIPTQPSPSPSIALFPPTSNGQHVMQQHSLSPGASSASFMDAFSVAAPQTPGGGMMTGSPYGAPQMQGYGLGVGMGLSPMATGATMSSGSAYSPSPTPSIPGFGMPTNPFQQQQQHQQQQQQQQMMMGMGNGLGTTYGGFPAAAASTGALGMPFSPGGSASVHSSYSASSSPAPFSQPFQQQQQQQAYVSSPMSPGGMMMGHQQMHQQQQPPPFMQQGLGMGMGMMGNGVAQGMQVQAQPTGFDSFANGMMPAHMRRQNQGGGAGGGLWG